MARLKPYNRVNTGRGTSYRAQYIRSGDCEMSGEMLPEGIVPNDDRTITCPTCQKETVLNPSGKIRKHKRPGAEVSHIGVKIPIELFENACRLADDRDVYVDDMIVKILTEAVAASLGRTRRGEVYNRNDPR